MQTQIKLLEAADEKKTLQFIKRAALSNECEKCSNECPIYEECDGWTDIIGGNPVNGVGIIEIMAPRVYFRGSLQDAYGGYMPLTYFMPK